MSNDAGLKFLAGVLIGLELVAAMMSSPWAVSNFAGTPARSARARKYVSQAVVGSLILGGAAAALTRNWMPVIGAATGVGFMWWSYEDALAHASGEQTLGNAG